MREVGDAVILEDQTRAQLPLRPRNLSLIDPFQSGPVEGGTCCPFELVERHPSRGREGEGVEERIRSCHQGAVDLRRQSPLDERRVEKRLALGGRHSKARPEIQALCACEHRVQHQHREKIVLLCGRRVPGELQVCRRALPLDADTTLPHLRWLRDLRPHGGRARADSAEMPLRATKHIVGLHVADDHQGGVRRNVVATVVGVQILARDGLKVRQPADRRVPVRVSAKCGGGHLAVEELLRVVLPSLKLRDDDRPLGFAVRRVEDAAVHPLGLDEQHLIQGLPACGLQIGRLVDPGVAVPGPSEPLHDPLHLLSGNARGPLEVHVLDPVGDPGQPGTLVTRSHPVPAPHRHEGDGVHLLNEHAESVIEVRHVQRGRIGQERARGEKHPFII